MGKSEKKGFYKQSVTSPGPIYYYEDDVVKSSSKGFKFSNDEKLKGIRNTTPGPGNYDHGSYIGKGANKFSMGMKTSSKINIPSDNPGPGAYEINDFNKPNPKSFKISTKSSSNINRNNIPGPGQYSPEKKTNNPKWTMGSKSESTSLYGRLEKLHEGTPAPGNYDVCKTFEGPKVKN